MEKLCNFDKAKILRINVSGTIFMCSAEILKSFPESFLANLDKQVPNHENNEYFFDRNPFMFGYILDTFRKGSVHLPNDMCGTTFKEELEFWEVPLRHVAPCCLEALYRSDEDMSTMKKLMQDHEENTKVFLLRQKDKSVKNQFWLFLDEPASSKYALIWATFISALIVVSIFVDALSTVPIFHVNYTQSERQLLKKAGQFLNWDNSTYENMSSAKPHPYLKLVDFLINIVITLECLISFIVCPNKKAFVTSLVRICTVFGYLSFWIAFVMQTIRTKILDSEAAVIVYTLFSYLTILKIIRLFYLARRTPAFGIIGLTLRSTREELKILTLILALLVSIFGVFMFVAEFPSSEISNIFIGMYLALITVTTVGYGDYAPATPAGHVIAGACAVCGILILALPIGIIASSFYTFYNYHKYARRHFHNSANSY